MELTHPCTAAAVWKERNCRIFENRLNQFGEASSVWETFLFSLGSWAKIFLSMKFSFINKEVK